jgi:gliding motility-associated-like protein
MLLTPVSSGVNSWLWQDGSTNASILITSAGEYVVTVSNLCGIAQDTLQATLLPATPTFELGPDTALCPGFSYTLQIEVTGVDILWSDGSTTPELVATMPGFISAMITNGCGEENDTVEISALPPAPVLNLGLDQSLCIGETIIVDPGLNNVDYLWQDGTASSTYQSTQEETIILTVSNDCGADTDTLEITESTEGPQVDLGLDITGCAGDTVILSSNISGVDYEWNDGSTHNQLQVLQSGTYSIAVSNLCGSDMDTVIVDLSGLPPAVALGADTSVCEGAILILAATVSSGAQITWQDGSHTFGYQVIGEGIYWVVGSNVCGEDTDSLIVTYQYPPEAFTLGPDTVLCPDEFITLTVPLTGYDILWQNGSQQSSIIADQDGIYLLTLSNHCGSVSDDIEVSLDQRTPVIRLEANYEWCEGDEITLNVLQPFPATYLWSDGSTGSAITISTPGIYTVEVSTECQTISEDITVISVEPCKPQVVIKDDIYIPNVFSPNDDGINDLFTPLFGSDLQVIQLSGSVYDRWGSELYATEGSTFSWDGRFKGETLNPGVYVYTILVNYKFDGRDYEERFSGDVTLVR